MFGITNCPLQLSAVQYLFYTLSLLQLDEKESLTCRQVCSFYGLIKSTQCTQVSLWSLNVAKFTTRFPF